MTAGSIGATLADAARRFAEANGFAAKSGQYLALPAANGEVAQILFGLGDASDRSHDPFLAGKLPGLLPDAKSVLLTPGSNRWTRARAVMVPYRRRHATSGSMGPPAAVPVSSTGRPS